MEEQNYVPPQPNIQEAHPAGCESCGTNAELYNVEHHQPGNDRIWHYCATCKAAHDKETGMNATLRALQSTHPTDVNRMDVLHLVQNGSALEDIKRYLDTTKQPELEAEVVE